ncbi:hypothetical protein ACQP1G_20955 [Nocardia sp. CA-107356]|uniref:hypothetical protein n=1 Tax=Nocardia sp. CA-107356 TaxID=3239972 RepID=UPI003D91CD44
MSEPIIGELTELVVTQAGDLVGRIQFEIDVDQAPSPEIMLLPASDMWEPATDQDRDRLRKLVREFDIRW